MKVDYQLAFELAPVGLALSRHRVIVDCNLQLCQMFGISRVLLLGQSFAQLYPSPAEYERMGARMRPILMAQGHYADDRVMRRASGESFWCHISGRALDPSDPHATGIWSFEDLSARRAVKTGLTPREREVAAQLISASGQTSKAIARQLGISHRTVEVYRARLMRKYQAANTVELLHKLIVDGV